MELFYYENMRNIKIYIWQDINLVINRVNFKICNDVFNVCSAFALQRMEAGNYIHLSIPSVTLKYAQLELPKIVINPQD